MRLLIEYQVRSGTSTETEAGWWYVCTAEEVEGSTTVWYPMQWMSFTISCRAISLVILNFASHRPQLHIMRLVATLSLVVVVSLNLASFRFSYSKEQQYLSFIYKFVLTLVGNYCNQSDLSTLSCWKNTCNVACMVLRCFLGHFHCYKWYMNSCAENWQSLHGQF